MDRLRRQARLRTLPRQMRTFALRWTDWSAWCANSRSVLTRSRQGVRPLGPYLLLRMLHRPPSASRKLLFPLLHRLPLRHRISPLSRLSRLAAPTSASVIWSGRSKASAPSRLAETCVFGVSPSSVGPPTDRWIVCVAVYGPASMQLPILDRNSGPA